MGELAAVLQSNRKIFVRGEAKISLQKLRILFYTFNELKQLRPRAVFLCLLNQVYFCSTVFQFTLIMKEIHILHLIFLDCTI